MLWIDGDNAVEQRIAEVDDPHVRSAITSLWRDGYAIVTNAFPPELSDQALTDFYRFCTENPEHSKEFTMESGLHSRLYNLHIQSDALFSISQSPKILSVLDAVFDRRAALNSTLFFEQGSQQDIHRDTPFFTADVFPGQFCGVWYAFEDVFEDAGPLEYVPQGHRIPIDVSEADDGDVGSRFIRYCEEIKRQCDELRLEKKTLILKKGDALIWHPELPHGGSEIKQPGKTRFSMVAHYMPEGAYIQTVGYFFKMEGPQKIMEFIGTSTDRLMRWVDKPCFMPNA